jgi:CRP/FNR family transcriptional regulator, anaerobic regulatory protein
MSTARAPSQADAHRSTLAQACRLLRLPEVAGAKQVDATFLHRRLKAGHRLTSQGEPFEALYIVADGYFKTFVADETGNQLVLGFPLRGDLVGADGLCNHRHASYAVALTDAEVVVIPFRSIAHLGRSLDDFEQLIYRAISRELVTDYSLRSLIGTLGAEARVARFLANFADRRGEAGRTTSRFTLPMTRQEIGSYLGLTLETVSRAFSALAEAGLIHVAQREIELLDVDQLRTLQKLAPASGGRGGKRSERQVRRNVTWVDMLGAAA